MLRKEEVDGFFVAWLANIKRLLGRDLKLGEFLTELVLDLDRPSIVENVGEGAVRLGQDRGS